MEALKEILTKVDAKLYVMLLELAKCADPMRYFPFPTYFRTVEGKEIIPGIESYSPDDYAKVVAAQQKVPLTKEEAVAALVGATLDEETVIIMQYIFNVNFAMAYYGNTYSQYIEEYEYRYDAITELYRNKKYRERWYLFHGSNPSNWHSILRNGIRNMSHTSLMTTGAVHGAGIYASDQVSVSFSYGTKAANGVQNTHDKSYIAVIELREPYESYRKASGIYVLPDSVSFVPRYLLKVDARATTADLSGKILTFYSELRKKAAATPTVQKRFQRDINELYLHNMAFEHSVFDIKEEEALGANIHDVNVKIYYASYPAEAPIVTVDTKTIDEKTVAAMSLKQVEGEFVMVLPCTEAWSPLDTLKKVFEECSMHIAASLAAAIASS